jgi:hypothetical protein
LVAGPVLLSGWHTFWASEKPVLLDPCLRFTRPLSKENALAPKSMGSSPGIYARHEASFRKHAPNKILKIEEKLLIPAEDKP